MDTLLGILFFLLIAAIPVGGIAVIKQFGNEAAAGFHVRATDAGCMAALAIKVAVIAWCVVQIAGACIR